MTIVRRDREWFRAETAHRLARQMAALSTCKRLRVGCAIVSAKLERVMAVGYNGPPAGLPNESCRDEVGACGCVHAEANAISKLEGGFGVMHVTRSPCAHCAGMIVNSRRVAAVVYGEAYRDPTGVEVLRACGVPCDPYRSVVPSVVVVGERANAPSRPVDASPSSPEDAWRTSLAAGAFVDGRSAGKLASIGVDLSSVRSANLLPPSDRAGDWDADRAEAVARAATVDQPTATWLACGRRCWRALTGRSDGEFGDRVAVGSGGIAVLIPHPSGLSRWWNDRANPTRLRRRIDETIDGQDLGAVKPFDPLAVR